MQALQHLAALTGVPASSRLTHALLMGVPFWIVWAALVPLVAWWLDRRPAIAGVGELVRHHVPAAVVLSLLHTMIAAVVNSLGEVGRGPTLLSAVSMEYPWALLPNMLAAPAPSLPQRLLDNGKVFELLIVTRTVRPSVVTCTSHGKDPEGTLPSGRPRKR